eukprot:jgi/Tetstr1/427795/TSEL_017913.t1
MARRRGGGARRSGRAALLCAAAMALLGVAARVAADAGSELPDRRPELAVAGCDVYAGSWRRVADDKRRAYPYDGGCPYIDQRQTCPGKDRSYLDWEWQPAGCALPFFDAPRFLGLLRNRVLAFVGDSLGRNQFESLSCLLAPAGEMVQTGKDSELHVKRHYPTYNATIELILSPYLVEHSPRTYSRNMGHKQVHLDIPDPDWHTHYKDFDVILFTASGRWFLGSAKFAMKYTQKKYRQPTGNKVQIMFHPPATTPWSAIRRAFKTVRRSLKTKGVFLWKTYSPSHYAGAPWDQGGHCHDNTYPSTRTDDTDPNIQDLSEVMRDVARPGLSLFNVTHMASQRNDAHPGDLNNIAQRGSSAQDCVHWCLPGVPDVWNRFLLVQLERSLTRDPEL